MAKRSFAGTGVRGKKRSFFIVLAVIILGVYIAWQGLTLPFQSKTGRDYRLYSASEIRFGIDIRGGVEAVYTPKDFEGEPTAEQMQAAASVLNVRLDKLQILDREVITGKGNNRIIVRFPWKSDETSFNPDEALKELGEMALLTFKGPDGNVILDGSDVKEARAVLQSNTDQPVVSLEFKESGKEKFAAATEKFLGQNISIYLDQAQISSAQVRSVIRDGSAIIEGRFTREQALDLAQKINGGALPFALEAINSSTISPKLGSNSLRIMTLAGAIAFAVICILMIVFYRLPGVVACVALTAQVVGILLGISVPQQTLTLQGIAGIILSIGMGVDANVIISSRIREEANTGAALHTFLGNGFRRAFSSVMDGNVTVAIAAIILMIFGSGTMLSFGYSLLLGVILNGITGVWMTRLMIGSLSAFPALRNPWLYGKRKGGVA